ncbi:MAG TPA: UDP-N-acetylmuramoyl-tripeptide--D-alanyl-D-alanine ligase [Candidatus Acidoferrales bacterium]|nr:UDP-N-acetylmuramoyl-tripeptide--D-alanyl-D-alanine ligase [Candidatus Acidoferrales bacterium]
MRWTVAEMADALGVPAPAPRDPLARLAGVSIDSRTVKPGELFIAIRGPRHDGHTYVAASLAAGAVAAVVASSRLAEYPEEIRPRLLAVDDTLRSLQELASKYCDAWRKAKPGRRLAAVTGSAGKTTTKEILAALLAARWRVLKSEGNLNNEYGLPLTLFRLEDEHDAAVVELGMSHRGELARLAEIARPDVGVVTNVAPVHLEFFSSIDEIALAKRELIEGLGGENPVAVLNADDERVVKFAEGFRGSVRYFGFSDRADFRAENIDDRGLDGSAFDFEGPDELGRLTLPLAGQHNILNALAALAAASEWGIGLAEAKEVFPKLQPASLRGEILRFADGFVVINDCYNSNPVALARMVDLLCATLAYRRRILVAGEWREIGLESAKLHLEGGKYAAEKKSIDWIFGVEGHASDFVSGAIAAGHPADRAEFFPSSEVAAKFLASFVSPGDLILVKGSRGVRMEVIAKALEERFALASDIREVTVKSGRERQG